MNKTIEDILNKNSGAGMDSLIPILQEIQDAEGWLSEEAMTSVGTFLKMPSSKVYGVATFYNQFRFQPKGRFHIQVCRGTACHVLGSASVLEEIKKIIRIDVDETTKDGMFSLEIVACMGTCGLAPVICVNGNFHAGVTQYSLRDILASYKEQANN